jgi:hypothetical protein
MKYRLLSLFLTVCWMLVAGQAQAHQTSVSRIEIEVSGDGIDLTLILPQDQLLIVLPEYPNLLAQGTLPDSHALQQYLADHLWITRDKRRYSGLVYSSEPALEKQFGVERPVLKLQIMFPALDGTIQLHSDVILHEVRSHKTYVTLNRSYTLGVFETKTLGVLRHNRTEAEVALGKASAWKSMSAMFVQGIDYIVSRPDHLLFLFCLLVTVPLIKTHNGWQATSRSTAVIPQTILIVTGFTLAHGLTLALSTFGYLPAGGQWVEVFIALTVFYSALLVLYPLPHIEGFWFASSFGLIHGLAFSQLLIEMNLRDLDLITALISFTLGIEFIQFLLVIMVVPCLMQLVRNWMLYRAICWSVAITALAAAIVWVMERVSGLPNASTQITEWILYGAPFAYLAILALALLSYFTARGLRVSTVSIQSDE